MITLVNVSKVIGKQKVLDCIDLQLEDGQIHAFFGANGSGKSMLFRSICGLIKPTEGKVVINGNTLHKDCSFPDSIGIVIESPGFWESYTGLENLKMLASIKNKIDIKEIRRNIARVGLDPDDRRNFKKYSLGMKQRLAIAQAIMEQPDILILDEPTNALDEDGVDLVRSIILEEKHRGATILIASHNKEDLDILADKRFRVKNGKVTSEDGESN